MWASGDERVRFGWCDMHKGRSRKCSWKSMLRPDCEGLKHQILEDFQQAVQLIPQNDMKNLYYITFRKSDPGKMTQVVWRESRESEGKKTN